MPSTRPGNISSRSGSRARAKLPGVPVETGTHEVDVGACILGLDAPNRHLVERERLGAAVHVRAVAERRALASLQAVDLEVLFGSQGATETVVAMAAFLKSLMWLLNLTSKSHAAS